MQCQQLGRGPLAALAVLCSVCLLCAGCPLPSTIVLASDGAPLDAVTVETGDGPEVACTMCSGVCTDTADDPDNCGSCFNRCPMTANASPACDMGHCSLHCASGYALSNAMCVPIPAPQPIAPTSTAWVNVSQPVFEWVLPTGVTGARVTVCSDAACTHMVGIFDANGTSGSLSAALTTGRYFWSMVGLAGSNNPGSARSPLWQFHVLPHTISAPAISYGTVMDVNNDGNEDVAMTGSTSTSAETAVVRYGTPTGLSATPITTVNYPGTLQGPGFGEAVGSAGDVNGDGYADLLVGAPDGSEVYLFFGGQTGLSTMPATVIPAPEGGVNVNFGQTLGSAGDLNHDGYGDVYIADPGYHPDRCMGDGIVYVFLGGMSGLNETPATTLQDPTGANTGEQFGLALANVGDIDGDSRPDVVIGGGWATKVWVFRSGTSVFSNSPAPTVINGPAGMVASNFGSALGCAGDINGDGYPDLIIGARGVNSGSGAAYYSLRVPATAGQFSAATPVNFQSTIALGASAAGYAVAGLGDVNADGFADVAIGLPYGGTGAGVVAVASGSASGLGTAAPIGGSGSTANGYFGSSIVGVDVDADGIGDMFVGAPGLGTVVGRAFLLLGRDQFGTTVTVNGTTNGFGNQVAMNLRARASVLRARDLVDEQSSRLR